MRRHRVLRRVVHVIYDGLRDRDTNNVFKDVQVRWCHRRLRARCLQRRFPRRRVCEQFRGVVKCPTFILLFLLLYRICQGVNFAHRSLCYYEARVIMRRLRFICIAVRGTPRRILYRNNDFLVKEFVHRVLRVTFNLRSRFLRAFHCLPTCQMWGRILRARKLMFVRGGHRVPSSVYVRPTARANVKNGRSSDRALRFAFRGREELRLAVHARGVNRSIVRPSFMEGRIFCNDLHLVRLNENCRLRDQDGFPHVVC